MVTTPEGYTVTRECAEGGHGTCPGTVWADGDPTGCECDCHPWMTEGNQWATRRPEPPTRAHHTRATPIGAERGRGTRERGQSWDALPAIRDQYAELLGLITVRAAFHPGVNATEAACLRALLERHAEFMERLASEAMADPEVTDPVAHGVRIAAESSAEFIEHGLLHLADTLQMVRDITKRHQL